MNVALRLLSEFCPLITLLSVAPIHLPAGEIFPIANGSAIESGGDAAFDGHNYLIGVQGGPFGEGPITAQLVLPAGTLVRGGISPGKSGGMPRLAFDGANYFMVWAGSEADPGLKGQFVSKAGDLVGSVLNLHPTASLTPTATSVAYGGGKYLACWSDGTRLLGQLVNPDRTLSGASFTVSGSTLEPRENAMVFDGANFFVAFNGGAGNLPNIYGQIVSPQGGLIGGTLLIDDTPDPSDNPLTVSCDGSHYLVAFTDEVGGLDSGTWHLYGKRVSTSGTVLPERLTLVDNPGAQRFPFAAFDGSNHLIAWGEGAEMDAMNLVMRFFDPAGQPAGAAFSPFTPQGSNRPLFGVPLFNGTDYFVTAALVSFTADHEVASADVYGTFVPKNTPPALPFTYTTQDGEVTITKYTGSGGVVGIPVRIDGLPVACIGWQAFAYCSSLTKVTIPDTVTSIEGSAFDTCTSLTNVVMGTNVASIGGWAFGQCIGLTSITIPDNVTNIGSGAFSWCWRLTDVRIPRNVTTIGATAFDYCTALSAISVAPDNSVYVSIAGVLFDKKVTRLIQYPSGRDASEYTIPNTVTQIEAWALRGSRNLTNLVIADSVSNIGEYAFAYCERLLTVTIPEGVSGIGNAAFSSCPQLNAINVVIGNPVYSSVAGVLFNKSQTVLIQYPVAKPGSEYTIPVGVDEVGKQAFESCSSLTSVVLPTTVTRIGVAAFDGCRRLMSVSIPESVTVIGQSAFEYCSSLITVSIPNRVTNVPSTAFAACDNLQSATVGKGVTNLAYGAFGGCSALKELYFQGDAPTVDASCFEMATNVTVYYSPATTGWGSSFGGRPAAPWDPHMPTADPLFGVRQQGFGFRIAGTSNLVIVIEATGSLGNPLWLPVATNTLTSGSSYFNDPRWTNSPTRFYRLRSP